MALSQIQCLDENHVNPRTHENKPEFLYCENQRLALEVLLQDGREAFHGFLKARELRGFLSDSELDVLTRLVVPYDPGSDVLHASPLEDSGDGVPLSLHYWPDLSDTSVPDLDLGWPDSASYRGVTRTTVYTQPPQEGQAHIKEIIRKSIAQATKVIAVVMDLFTDVDIFRDLLEAGYKRKVSVYILLEPSTLPHFLSMCDRAKMHPGQLKNLRVRCAGGGEFLTRSCTQLRGRLGHRFMFVDGDKAVSGSYRYTWMSSRLDKHLITVVTGQAVDAFDRLFCELYGTSSAVDLKQVAMEPEPEPEYIPQPVAVAPSAEVTRKRYNPMYALLGMSMNNANPASGSVPHSPLDSNTQDKVGMGTKAKRKMAAQVEAPPLHPGLMDMEKAYMIPYLPTWPEPDPDSNVIGFINVRDNSRQSQVHMQRSERFETSQAIRFSSPFSMPKEILPEVAQLRQRDSYLQYIQKKAYPTQVGAQEVAVYKEQPISPITRLYSTLATKPLGRDVHMILNKSVHIMTSETKIKAEKQPVNTESKPSTNPASQQITTPHIDTPTSFSDKAPIIKTGSAVPTRPVHYLIQETTDTEKKIHIDLLSNLEHTLTSNPASSPVQASPIAVHQQNAAPTVQTQNRIANKVSCKQDLGTKPQSPSKEDYIPSIPSPNLSGSISASKVSPTQPPIGRFTSPYVTTSVSVTSSPSRSITKSPVVPPASPSISSPLPSSSISSSYFNPSMNFHSSNTSPLLCSGPSTSPLTPPVPKPRTIHLLMDSGSKCNALNQPFDCGVVMEQGKLSGFGPVVDDCTPVSKQQEDAFMTSTRKQISPKTVVNSTTKYAELQERRDIKTHLVNDVKDGSYREFPDPKKATNQMPQSILTVNTLQANDNQFEETRPKESGNTNQAGFLVRSPRVIEELSKPDKVSNVVTKPDFQQATQHVLTNEGLLQKHSQTHAAKASESPSSFHTSENNKAIDNQHIPKPNNDTPGSLSIIVVDSISRVQTQGGQRRVKTYPFNDEAVNNVHYRLNPDKGKAENDSRTPEKPTRPHNGRSCPIPDPRTPTPDTSDGYVSSKADSELSTTSDEYYECDETRRPSPVFDQGIGLDNGTTDHSFKAQTKYGVGSEGESEREYKVRIGNDRAAILAAGERHLTGLEGLSQIAKKGCLLPLKTTKQEKSFIYNSPQGQSEPLEPLGVDGYPRSASGKKSADIETSPPPIFRQIRRSSSSASSENTVSPFITPAPSPAPTPKRAAAQPSAAPPDTVVAGPAVVSGPRVQPEAKQVIRKDSRGESAELTRKWEEGWNFRRDEEKDPELFTKGGLGTSSGESHSETSALRTSGAQIRRGPWVRRETEEKKGLQTPQGWPKPPNHQSPVPFQSPAAKPTIPPPPTTVPQLARSYQQVSSRVDALQTQQDSTPQQGQNRRHSSMTTARSLKGADRKSPVEAFSRRSLNHGHPLTGQGSGALPKPQPSFLYSYANSQSQLQRQTQPMIAGDQMAPTVSSQQSTYRQVSAMGDPEPGDSGQDLNKSGFRICVGKLYSIKGLKNKGSSSPSQTKRNPDSLAQPHKSTG
ncbi:uncharacterized protein LOC132470107 [Gadus macrocephalus]|uniref:uncharacterized protein LOC132470107 n=1 Tax=Gadus macrocephalus TaxID=80720 RepID=UPI0028CB8510|nr:uncharacterized protein LOC132470107 [Gadus macrocephalus]